jgi:ornithine--oxo-acid transaminase
VGIELDPERAPARRFVESLLAHGILSKDTHGTVARFAPPLVISEADLDWGIERIRETLREFGPVHEKAAAPA